MLAGLEMTAVLDASMTENGISFKTLYELKPFPKFQHCENKMVWTESGPTNIVAEICPKILVGHQVGYVNILGTHDIVHSAILGSKFLKEHDVMAAAHIKLGCVEDYCEGSEAMENEEHFQRVENVGLLTTAPWVCWNIQYHVSPCKKISSDPAGGINGLDTSSRER